jgi:hypothetical protein
MKSFLSLKERKPSALGIDQININSTSQPSDKGLLGHSLASDGTIENELSFHHYRYSHIK